MIPISDNNSDRTITPFINYFLIGLNIFVFVYYQSMGANEAFTLSMATVPQEILTGLDISTGGLGITPIPVYGTIFTAMFMHGSIAHLAGNMLYLWVFGDNLENRMGHFRYLAFYIICGVIATLCHVFYTSALGYNLLVPSLGASGAISGVLGGYLLLYPKNEIRVFAGFLFLKVPAFLTLGFWIIMQFVSNAADNSETGGGVAYAAHIGGFIAGLVLVKVFSPRLQQKTNYVG